MEPQPQIIHRDKEIKALEEEKEEHDPNLNLELDETGEMEPEDMASILFSIVEEKEKILGRYSK